jgi:hypothetical protein
MGITTSTLERTKAFLADPGERRPDEILNTLLRGLAKWRTAMIANTVVARHGRKILSGPFEGMDYVDHAAEGALLPRLIGCYESELHPHLAALAAEGLDTIVDVGCAEGYYAVGLARMIPGVQVHAFDIDPRARRDCAALAALNGVSDRVHVGETFAGEDFARFAGPKTLIFMDIEGGEATLLDPEKWPALRELKVVVETHPGPSFALTDHIAALFAPSHEVIRIDHGPKNPDLPPVVRSLGHLDQILSTWEWRL